MRIEGNHLIFESGKEVYAYRGIVGLWPGGSISGGYDHAIDKGWNTVTEELEDVLSPEDKRELARYMIEKWSQFLEEDK